MVSARGPQNRTVVLVVGDVDIYAQLVEEFDQVRVSLERRYVHAAQVSRSLALELHKHGSPKELLAHGFRRQSFQKLLRQFVVALLREYVQTGFLRGDLSDRHVVAIGQKLLAARADQVPGNVPEFLFQDAVENRGIIVRPAKLRVR